MYTWYLLQSNALKIPYREIRFKKMPWLDVFAPSDAIRWDKNMYTRYPIQSNAPKIPCRGIKIQKDALAERFQAVGCNRTGRNCVAGAFDSFVHYIYGRFGHWSGADGATGRGPANGANGTGKTGGVEKKTGED
jgi:hypothetical protein